MLQMRDWLVCVLDGRLEGALALAHCSPTTVSTINTFCKSIFVTAMKNLCLALHHFIDNKGSLQN